MKNRSKGKKTKRKTATKEEAGENNPNPGTETGEQKSKKQMRKVNDSPKTLNQLKDLRVVDIFRQAKEKTSALQKMTTFLLIPKNT